MRLSRTDALALSFGLLSCFAVAGFYQFFVLPQAHNPADVPSVYRELRPGEKFVSVNFGNTPVFITRRESDRAVLYEVNLVRDNRQLMLIQEPK